MKCSSILFVLLVLAERISASWQMQPRCPVLRLQNGRVRARARGRIVRFSCFDGFTLVGNKYSTCVRGEWDTPTPVCVNAECPMLATPEHALVAAKYNGAILIYFCEAGYALIGAAEIYCDGRQWNGTAPYCRNTSEQAPTRCDFEKPDLCWWEQDPQHDFDWQRHNFETPSSHIGTGPTHDHTLGPGNDGYYLYIEASGRLVNDTARIVSPLYNSSLSDDGCFTFWYHMYGATIGSLRVYFKPENETTPRLMFTKDGNQGNQWLQETFRLPKVDTNFQIIIEGVRGASYVSDIAVDDVAILHGNECSANKSISTNSTARDDDQVELVNSQMSCRGRCGSPLMEMQLTTPLPGSVWIQDVCHCTADCAENSTCCPDYAEYCVLAFTEVDSATNDVPEVTTVSTTKNATTPKPSTIRNLPTTTHWTTKTTTQPSGNTSRNVIPTNPRDDIDPSVVKPPVDVGTSAEPSKAITGTPRRALTTVAKTNITRTTATSTSTKHTPSTKETPFVRSEITTEFAHLEEKTTVSPAVTSIYLLHEKLTISWIAVVLEVLAALIGIATIAVTISMVIKKRRACKRNSSALSEDSDVRFLTSDEMLDFNLARPNDNDDT